MLLECFWWNNEKKFFFGKNKLKSEKQAFVVNNGLNKVERFWANDFPPPLVFQDDEGPADFADQLAARIKDATKKPEADRTCKLMVHLLTSILVHSFN